MDKKYEIWSEMGPYGSVGAHIKTGRSLWLRIILKPLLTPKRAMESPKINKKLKNILEMAKTIELTRTYWNSLKLTNSTPGKASSPTCRTCSCGDTVGGKNSATRSVVAFFEDQRPTSNFGRKFRLLWILDNFRLFVFLSMIFNDFVGRI